MPNRTLRPQILTSLKVNKLSVEAELFYRRLMSVVDDFGRYYADPALLRAGCFPLRTDAITCEQVRAWVCECVQAQLLDCYCAQEREYLILLNLGNTRASTSKYPDPPVQADASRCEQTKASVSVSVSVSDSLSYTNTNSVSDARAAEVQELLSADERLPIVCVPPKPNGANGFVPDIERFKERYPGPVNQIAEQYFCQIAKDEHTQDVLFRNLERWNGSDQWKRGIGIKAAKNWLSEGDWKVSPKDTLKPAAGSIPPHWQKILDEDEQRRKAE